MAFLYVPAKMRADPYVIRADDDVCFASSETVCDTHAVSTFYFWNLTNPAEVVAGTAPPALREVGPFVMHKTREKKSNVTFHQHANTSAVSFVSTTYAEWDEASFCDGCSLSDPIVSFNAAYYTLVKTYGSETNFLYSLTPKVVPGVLQGIVSVFAALAADPATAAAMPHVAAAAADPSGDALLALAEAQWGDCSPLGGSSVTALALPPETLALFPVAPEFGAYAASATGAPASAFGLAPGATLDAVYALLTTDETGGEVLVALQTPDADLASSLGLASTTHASLVKGYVASVAGSYGKNAAQAAMGPFLGPNSSGLFVRRPVEEWLEGYADPLTSARYDPSDPRYLVRAITKTFHARDLEPETFAERVPYGVSDSALWPGLGATPWTVATGADDPNKTLDVLVATNGRDSNETEYAYGGGENRQRVRGKMISRAVYPGVRDEGLETKTAIAWFDFGSSLDLGRSVRLEYAGAYDKPHEDVKLRTFALAREELEPCPIRADACAFSPTARAPGYHGAWDVSEHRAIPTVVTMPHGHRADPRLFGYVDAADPASSPFAPNATAHEMEWDVFETTGNVLGMRLRYQNNFQVKPTDVFYPNLWQPGPGSALDGRDVPDDGIYLPIAWVDVSYRVPRSKILDIAGAVAEARGLFITYTLGLPASSLVFIVYACVNLHVRRKIAKGRERVEDQIRAELRREQTVRAANKHRRSRDEDEDEYDDEAPLAPVLGAFSRRDPEPIDARGGVEDDKDASVVVVNVGEVNEK